MRGQRGRIDDRRGRGLRGGAAVPGARFTAATRPARFPAASVARRCRDRMHCDRHVQQPAQCRATTAAWRRSAGGNRRHARRATGAPPRWRRAWPDLPAPRAAARVAASSVRHSMASAPWPGAPGDRGQRQHHEGQPFEQAVEQRATLPLGGWCRRTGATGRPARARCHRVDAPNRAARAAGAGGCRRCRAGSPVQCDCAPRAAAPGRETAAAVRRGAARKCRCAVRRHRPGAAAHRRRTARCRADSRAAARRPARGPRGRSRLRSFSECTVKSTRPSRSAESISAVKNSLPSIADSGTSSTLSPRVSMPTSSTSSPGCAAAVRPPPGCSAPTPGRSGAFPDAGGGQSLRISSRKPGRQPDLPSHDWRCRRVSRRRHRAGPAVPCSGRPCARGRAGPRAGWPAYRAARTARAASSRLPTRAQGVPAASIDAQVQHAPGAAHRVRARQPRVLRHAADPAGMQSTTSCARRQAASSDSSE